MKAIFFAAGKGTRISSNINNVPKSTLVIDGKPLIRRNAELFLARNIPVIVCIGYHAEVITKALEGLNVTFYNNPFYSSANSITSLWFAKNELNDDLILLNADVYFDERILDDLINDKNKILAATDKTKCITGDYFFSLDKNQCIKKYGKNLDVNERNCEYIGIMKIKKEVLHDFTLQLTLMIENGEHNKWWEDVVYSLSDKGLNVFVKDYSAYFWCEIDYYDDYLKIQEHLKSFK